MANDDLRARVTEALNSAPSKLLNDRPESLAFHLERLDRPVLSSRHDRHTYMATCALCRGEADTLADAVLAVVQPELVQLCALNDEAWGSVWLHGRWSWLTKNMTTPEREYAADCVARWSAALNADDGEPDRGEPEGLRWWREPAVPPSGLRGLLAHVGIDVAGRAITVDGHPIDDIGSAPPTPEPPCGYCGCTTPSADCTTCNHDEETPR